MVRLRSALACAALLAGVGSCRRSASTLPGNRHSIALSLDSSSRTVERGGSTDLTAMVTRGGGYTGDVWFAVDSTPSGVTVTTSVVQITDTSTTGIITFNVSRLAPDGIYPLTIRASGTGVSDDTATLTLVITGTGVPMIGVRISADFLMAAGTSETAPVTISRSNFAGPVTLAVTDIPEGISMAFRPDTVYGNVANATITVANSVAPGFYVVTVRGTGFGVPAVTTRVPILVTQAVSFTLSSSPDSLSVAPGADASSTIAVNWSGGVGPSMGFAVSGLPAGVTAGFSGAGPSAAVLTFTASGTAAAGVYTVTVAGTSGTTTAQTTIGLTVTAAGGAM
jgi:hypothetical protein